MSNRFNVRVVLSAMKSLAKLTVEYHQLGRYQDVTDASNVLEKFLREDADRGNSFTIGFPLLGLGHIEWVISFDPLEYVYTLDGNEVTVREIRKLYP